jgi:peptidoglycan hydrolase-like protein with peptidoglycan-binding domain
VRERALDRGQEIDIPRRAPRTLRAPRREDPSRLRRLLRWIRPNRPADVIAATLAACATVAVLVNALWLQPVAKPASVLSEIPKPPASASRQAAAKRTVPAAPAPPIVAIPTPPQPVQRPETAAVRPRSDLVANMQRELTQLGLYEGVADGMLGPRTDQAIREFEKSQGLKITGEPTATLLDMMRRARPKTGSTGSVAKDAKPDAIASIAKNDAGLDTTGSIARNEPVAKTEARPSSRVLAVQRVLARLGYGPVKLSGLPDGATRTSIEQFERDRGLKRTGEVNDRLVAELSVVTGTPVE